MVTPTIKMGKIQEVPKYEYYLKTWVGFYKEKLKEVYGNEAGDFWFDSDVERQKFINDLRKIEKELDWGYMATRLSQGYCCRTKTILHRVVELGEKRYYFTKDLGYNYPFSVARYVLEEEWGIDELEIPETDFTNSNVKVIQEWITGADNLN